MSKIASSKKTLRAVVAALGVALPSTAFASEPPSAGVDSSTSARIAELNEAGARAYESRNYRAAIEKFVEAYAIDHDPNLLFNLARCYEKLGEVPAAIEKYQAFLAAPGADTEGRIKANTSLAELERLRDQGGTKPAGDGPSGGESSTAEAGSNAESSSSSRGPWPWLTLGAGVLVTGAGATLYALGVHDHAQVTGSASYGNPSLVNPMTRAEAQSYVDSGDTKKLIGGIGLGLGGALIATSVVLFVTGKSESPAATQTARVTLAPSAGGFYAGYSRSF
jgi:hypothetical protein